MPVSEQPGALGLHARRDSYHIGGRYGGFWPKSEKRARNLRGVALAIRSRLKFCPPLFMGGNFGETVKVRQIKNLVEVNVG